MIGPLADCGPGISDGMLGSYLDPWENVHFKVHRAPRTSSFFCIFLLFVSGTQYRTAYQWQYFLTFVACYFNLILEKKCHIKIGLNKLRNPKCCQQMFDLKINKYQVVPTNPGWKRFKQVWLQHVGLRVSHHQEHKGAQNVWRNAKGHEGTQNWVFVSSSPLGAKSLITVYKVDVSPTTSR